MFLNERDANMRLQNTIIRKGGLPVKVIEFTTSDRFSFIPSVHDREAMPEPQAARLSDDDVDVEPVPLGYINYQGCALYSSRIPRRRYKQGLDKGAMHLENGGGRVRDVATDILRSEAFVECVMGQWPVANECHRAVSSYNLQGLAFDREWAIAPDNKLHYKGREVGTYSPDQGYSLEEAFTYLKESIEEAIND